MKYLLLSFLVIGCVSSTEESIETDVAGQAGGPSECGWPFVGTFTAPALPSGAGCWEARVKGWDVPGSADVLVMRYRANPNQCRLSFDAQCYQYGCHLINQLPAGALLDVWGDTSTPATAVTFHPMPSSLCR